MKNHFRNISRMFRSREAVRRDLEKLLNPPWIQKVALLRLIRWLQKLFFNFKKHFSKNRTPADESSRPSTWADYEPLQRALSPVRHFPGSKPLPKCSLIDFPSKSKKSFFDLKNYFHRNFWSPNQAPMHRQNRPVDGVLGYERDFWALHSHRNTLWDSLGTFIV